MLGGVVVILLGIAQNEFYYQRALNDTEIAQRQQRIEAKLSEIQQHSIDFQTFANAYVTGVLDGSEDTSYKREVLIANILAQDAAIDVSRNILDPSLSDEVSTYRTALRAMKAAVEQVSDVVSMGPFWAAASDLLVARNSLLDALQQHSDNIS